MMTKILSAVRQSIKSYEIQSNLDNEEVLVTLLAVDIYRGIVAEKKVVKKKTPANTCSNVV